jgi:hypothetical protein
LYESLSPLSKLHSYRILSFFKFKQKTHSDSLDFGFLSGVKETADKLVGASSGVKDTGDKFVRCIADTDDKKNFATGD